MAFILTKSALQLPFWRIVEKHGRGFRSKLLIAGTFVISTVPIIYIFSDHVNFMYVAQIVHGVGSGLAFPSWVGLWSRNSEIKQKSFDWSVYSTLTGIGVASAALIGANIAGLFGFVATFMVVWVMSLFGCIFLFCLESRCSI